MKPLCTYEDGHLLVAAVRVLCHVKKHPPTVEDLSELLGLSREWIGVNVGCLVNEGILLSVDAAFVSRLEVKDHRKLEELPRAAENTGLDDELKEFTETRRRQDEELGALFAGGDALKKRAEKMSELAKGLKSFKPKPPKISPLFKDSPPEDEA